MFMHKIFVDHVTINQITSNREFVIKDAVMILSSEYKEDWDNSKVSHLFRMKFHSAEDFSSLEKEFLSSDMVLAIDDFKDKFVVSDKHKNEKDAIIMALEFYQKMKALHIFASYRSLKNKERRENLESLRNFFKEYTLDSSTKNETFLAETLEKLIALPVDCIMFEASVAIDYVMSLLCSLANIRTREELKIFFSLFDNCVICNLNHNYIFISELVFRQHNQQ